VNENRRPGAKRAEMLAHRKQVADIYLHHAIDAEIVERLGLG
jgi:hypothetical protein